MEGKKLEVHGKKRGKNEKKPRNWNIYSMLKMLNDESMISKIGNHNFQERPNFVAKKVHYHHERKRNYLYEENKSSNIKDCALERLLSYRRNKIIA